jgi:hypothetical protein
MIPHAPTPMSFHQNDNEQYISWDATLCSMAEILISTGPNPEEVSLYSHRYENLKSNHENDLWI